MTVLLSPKARKYLTRNSKPHFSHFHTQNYQAGKLKLRRVKIMSEQTAATEKMVMPKHGEFCWNDLATTNVETCKKFYGELLGWKFKESDATGMAYSEISIDGQKTVGGMWQTDQCPEGEPSEMPPPHWMTYIAVDDVDASAAQVAELGGSVCVPPTDIPNTGRFAVINDPTGATFSLITLKR